MDLEHILLSAVGFHLHAIPMPGIFRETESKLQVTWGRGGENGEFLLNRYSFSWLHNTVNAIHATEPHNLKMVKIATSMLYIFHHNEKNLRKKTTNKRLFHLNYFSINLERALHLFPTHTFPKCSVD